MHGLHSDVIIFHFIFRMGELIEAGSQGQLTEELFERCFTVNDAVCRTLEAERVRAFIDCGFSFYNRVSHEIFSLLIIQSGTKIAVNEEEVSGKKREDGSKPLLDLGADNDEDEVHGDVPIRKAPAATVVSTRANPVNFMQTYRVCTCHFVMHPPY